MVILQVMKAEKGVGGTMPVTQPSISMIIICVWSPKKECSCVAVSYNKTNNLINIFIADYHLPNKSFILLVSHLNSIKTDDGLQQHAQKQLINKNNAGVEWLYQTSLLWSRRSWWQRGLQSLYCVAGHPLRLACKPAIPSCAVLAV